MKKLLVTLMTLSLMIMPFAVYGQSEQIASGASPPVSQQLVPEGNFALKLAPALNLGTPTTEVQAEDMLSSAGIVPKNGWIADYPMTPIVIGELQDAVVAAADANKLPMGKDDALKAFESVTAEFGLAIVPGSTGQYAENEFQPDPTVINNFYYDEGPPVVTYYAPPWDYYYLYDWVSYPFWCSGFYFPGFFILNDFDTSVVLGPYHHHFRITNHFFDRRINRLVTVDPTTRRIGRTVTASLGRNQVFRSPERGRAATSIFNHSLSRANRSMTGSLGNTGRQNGMNFRQGQARPFNAPNVTHGRSFSAAPRTGGRSFNSPSRSFGTAPRTGGRSFSPPSRSFGVAPRTGGRSFSPPSRSFGASPGFSEGSRGFFGGGFSRGGLSSGHSFGGFSGGHSFGGFSGGHSFGGGFSGGHGGRR